MLFHEVFPLKKQKIWSFLWKKSRKDKDFAKNFVILRPILAVMNSRYWRMNSVIAQNVIDSPRRAMWGDAAITRRALGGKCESHDIIKGVFWRLVFDIQESRKFERYCQSKATKDVLGMCLYASPFLVLYRIMPTWGNYIHIGVGFYVARSSISGNARAFGCGTGDKDCSHVFFLCRYEEREIRIVGTMRQTNRYGWRHKTYR